MNSARTDTPVSDTAVIDTAIIVVSYGNDPVRIGANTTAIFRQLEQDLQVDYFLLELLPASGISAYPPALLQQVNHVTVPSTAAHQGLFQKEALMNLGWRGALELQPYAYFIFCDADLHARDADWFRQIRQRLISNPGAAVQGFRTVQDSQDEQLKYSSLAAAYALDYQTDLKLTQGGCWGLSTALLQAGDGFNDRCYSGSGDCAFVVEYLNSGDRQYDCFLDQFRWYQDIHRELPFRAELDGVPVDLIHEHHGELKLRNHDGKLYSLDGFGSATHLIFKDSDGLLAWHDPGCAARQLLQNKQAMTSREKVRQMLSVAGLEPDWPEPDPNYRSLKARPLIELGSAQLQPPPTSQPLIRKVFDPSAIFGSNLPFSWCSNVERGDKLLGIPLAHHLGLPSLALSGADPAQDIVACLPFDRNWQPVSLASFSELAFLLDSNSEEPAYLRVQLISHDEHGQEIRSQMVPVDPTARSGKFQAAQFQAVQIPLTRFEIDGQPPLGLIHHLNFVAVGSARIKLAEIRLT